MAPRGPCPNPPLVAGHGIQPAAPTSSPSRHASTELDRDFPGDGFDLNWHYEQHRKPIMQAGSH